LLTREESDAMVDRIESAFDEHGYGQWAVEATGVTPFARLVGLSIPRFSAHFTPAVEVGWRLAPAFWSRGYATEGALAAVEFGLDTLQLDEVVSFTTETNFRSRRVMETPMIDRLTGEDPAALKSFTDMEPVGRLGLPSEIADAVVYLCTDQASFVSGVPFPVDGAFVAQ
jgi:hypothetical protein